MDEVKKVVLKLNWCYPCKYPKTNYRGLFETSDKHYKSFFKIIHFS